jgi:hypothetical protein
MSHAQKGTPGFGSGGLHDYRDFKITAFATLSILNRRNPTNHFYPRSSYVQITVGVIDGKLILRFEFTLYIMAIPEIKKLDYGD